MNNDRLSRYLTRVGTRFLFLPLVFGVVFGMGMGIHVLLIVRRVGVVVVVVEIVRLLLAT